MHCDRPVRDPIFRFLAQSKLLTWLGLELPRAINEDHLRLVAAMIAQLRDTLRDRVNGMQLYVAFYPGARASKSLIPLLDAQGIPSLDYSEDHFEKFIPEAPRLLDGHPSAAAIRFITHQIVTDLGLH
jgi:lysophospholipase L1-like esterase